MICAATKRFPIGASRHAALRIGTRGKEFRGEPCGPMVPMGKPWGIHGGPCGSPWGPMPSPSSPASPSLPLWTFKLKLSLAISSACNRARLAWRNSESLIPHPHLCQRRNQCSSVIMKPCQHPTTFVHIVEVLPLDLVRDDHALLGHGPLVERPQ